MSTLNEFQELINDITDTELLSVAEGLLKDMIEIQNSKEKIEMLEDGLSAGDRAAFWFFAMGLNREQVDLATNTVIGRRRFLLDKEKLEQQAKEIEKAENETDESEPTSEDD
jgi:hypothetical protein